MAKRVGSVLLSRRALVNHSLAKLMLVDEGADFGRNVYAPYALKEHTPNRTLTYPRCHRVQWGTASEGSLPKLLVLLENEERRTTTEHAVGAPGRTRTSTMFPPPDFESGYDYTKPLILLVFFGSLLCMCKRLCKFSRIQHAS